MINGKPDADFDAILTAQGMPQTEDDAIECFRDLAREEGLITNTSRMSPFWRLMRVIVARPVMWLRHALVNVVMANLFLATASGRFVDIFAWAVKLSRKPATAAEGVILFAKTDAGRPVTVPAGTRIQTERINGVIYTLLTTDETMIPPGVASQRIAVKGADAGAGFNLAPGYYRILPAAIDGIASVENPEDWLSRPGASEESDDELRDRTRNQFNLAGQYHVDAVYRGLIAGVAGISTDRIYFLHDAPRGPGTANAYILLDSGIASAPFIDTVNDYIMAQGYHGHGDDIRAFALPETRHTLTATLYLYAHLNLDDQARDTLTRNVSNLVRCAFRENTQYDVQKTWPYSRFSMSRLGEEIHQTFKDVESVIFSTGDIESDLSVPRLDALCVEIAP